MPFLHVNLPRLITLPHSRRKAPQKLNANVLFRRATHWNIGYRSCNLLDDGSYRILWRCDTYCTDIAVAMFSNKPSNLQHGCTLIYVNPGIRLGKKAALSL